MKQIKTFRITPENEKDLKEIAEYVDRSEGWVINMGLSEYISYIQSTPGYNKPFLEKLEKVNKDLKAELGT